jgi:hypothetical protein
MMIPCFISLLFSFRGGDDFAGPAMIFFLLINPAYRIFRFEPGRARWSLAAVFAILLILGTAFATMTIGRRLFPTSAATLGTWPDTIATAFISGRIIHILLFIHFLRAPR